MIHQIISNFLNPPGDPVGGFLDWMIVLAFGFMLSAIAGFIFPRDNP